MKLRNLNHINHWQTPPLFLRFVKELFNLGDFDPCPYLNDITKFDGLSLEWEDRTFINPPYSRQEKEAFVYHAIAQKKFFVMLLPVSTSTKLYHEHIEPNAKEIYLLNKRLPFIGVNTKNQGVNWHLSKVSCFDRLGLELEQIKASGQHDSMLVVFDGKKRESEHLPFYTLDVKNL